MTSSLFLPKSEKIFEPFPKKSFIFCRNFEKSNILVTPLFFRKNRKGWGSHCFISPHVSKTLQSFFFSSNFFKMSEDTQSLTPLSIIAQSFEIYKSFFSLITKTLFQHFSKQSDIFFAIVDLPLPLETPIIIVYCKELNNCNFG